MDARRRVRGLVQLTRPGNVVGAAVLAVVGAYVAAELTRPLELAVATSATALGTAAGNAINDYFDRDIDAINRPDRPIPAGRVRPADALVIAVVALGVAFATAVAVLPTEAIAIAVVVLVLLVSYTQVFKGTPGIGNVVVAALVASAIWFGGAAVGDLPSTAVLGALAGFATFTREVVKDIEDLPGDRSEGLRTLPVAVGVRRAWLVAGIALGLGGLVSPVPYLDGTFGIWYLAGLAPAIAVMALGWAVGRDDPATGQRRLKVGMYLALAAFILGRLGG
ncbi:MAG: geranylgeranylglycerol-phosphate geranylgeranyltransferase [Halobacteriales archaeon]